MGKNFEIINEGTQHINYRGGTNPNSGTNVKPVKQTERPKPPTPTQKNNKD